MIWIGTGNKWLDSKIQDLVNFDSELSSAACCNSPLTAKEVETLQRRFKSIIRCW